ncbi:hypothetical protein D3C73_956730 [compost metagenome]
MGWRVQEAGFTVGGRFPDFHVAVLPGEGVLALTRHRFRALGTDQPLIVFG